ncbi:MAG TPA: hypothetical protein VGQ83_12770 [Polyangia bacterium]|jgi:hypothetical protein
MSPVFLLLLVAIIALLFWANFWLGAAAALTAPYWLGPVVLRLKTRYPLRPQIEPYRPGVDPAPEWARLHLATVAAAFTPLGFKVAGSFQIAKWAAHVRTVVVLLLQPETRVLALGMAVFTEGAVVAKQASVIEIATRFAGDLALTTSNSDQINVFAPIPGRTCERFPALRDVPRLFRLHRALMARLAPDGVTELTASGPVELLLDGVTREMSAQVAAGLMWIDGEHYRPTWRGAAVYAWKLLFPWKQLERARLRRRAAALGAELGE